jgi:hypothetical protein
MSKKKTYYGDDLTLGEQIEFLKREFKLTLADNKKLSKALEKIRNISNEEV